MKKIQLVAALVVVLGVVSLVIGAVFIGLAVQKNDYITSSLQAQKVTLGLTSDQIAAGEVVDNAAEAQVAANTLAQHLSEIAPTYGALTATNKGGRFDATNPTDIEYGQGLNMENSFNLVVLSFGVIQEIIATGAALIIIGIAIGATGIVIFKLGKKTV